MTFDFESVKGRREAVPSWWSTHNPHTHSLNRCQMGYSEHGAEVWQKKFSTRCRAW